MGLIPGWGTKIPSAAWHGQEKKKKRVKGDDVELIWKVKDVAGHVSVSGFTAVLIFIIALSMNRWMKSTSLIK